MRRKNGARAAAAAIAALSLLAGCAGTSGAATSGYLKDIDVSKYVTLGDYTGLNVEVDAQEADAEGAEQYASYYMSLLSGSPVTDRTAQLGDVANIDFAGRYADSGEYFEGGTSEGYDLALGSGSFIPGFEEGVVGMAIGETKDIPLTFPENYGSAELAGADVIFEVTLNALTAPTDESVQALGLEGVTTLEEYAAALKREYLDNTAAQYREAVESAVRDKIEANAVFQTPPDELLARMKESYNEQIQIIADAYSEAYGQTITVSDLLDYAMSSAGYSGDEDGYITAGAIENANSFLMIAAIAEEQGISVSDEELRQQMEENLAGTDYATIEEYMEASDLEEIREQILYDKVMDYLVANNTVSTEE